LLYTSPQQFDGEGRIQPSGISHSHFVDCRCLCLLNLFLILF
jgi:predicted DNA-binding helix-hairpin-helix protein